MRHSRGLSLLEVAMAITLSLTLTAGGVYAYRQHMHAVRITQAKLMLQTIRQGIEMQRYRTGAFPTITQLQNNRDDRDQAFHGTVGSPLRDPILPPLSAADRSPINPGSVPGSPWGGWVYDQATGRIQPNLDPTDFPNDPPGAW